MKPSRNASNETAAQAYSRLQAECSSLLADIAAALRQHQQAAAAKPTYWTYVGDLEAVRGNLREALRAAGGAQ